MRTEGQFLRFSIAQTNMTYVLDSATAMQRDDGSPPQSVEMGMCLIN